MPRTSATLEQLFDRTWRPGHPFRPRLSPFRRWAMFCFLCFLLSIIAAYWYLTDATRVQKICEAYLAQLTGGHVRVQRATLSIFEGLRLDRVSIRIDKSGEFNTTFFDVQTVLIKYSPESILSGKLEATQIVAIDPRVQLCEDLDARADSRKWQRLTLPTQPSTQPRNALRVFPEIRLRNGQVHYSQIQNGVVVSLGTMTLDGVVTPDTPGACLFQLQSRVAGETIGPSVTGSLDTQSGKMTAELRRFEFGPGVKAMLPEEVRRFWEEHHLAGRVDIPSFAITPHGASERPEFRLEMDLQKVELTVNPNQWLSRIEQQQVASLKGAFELMRAVGLNGMQEGSGFRVGGSEEEGTKGQRDAGTKGADPSPSVPLSLSPSVPAFSLNPSPEPPTPNSQGFVDFLENTVTPSMIRLERVDGTFIFTQDGIQIKELNGLVERNWFRITGQIDGYAGDSPAALEVIGDDINIPHSPRYVTAMPRVIRQVYEGLHPEGNCKVWVKLVRGEPGKKPIVSGEVEVLRGQFIFDLFPYPLRNVTGKIAFGPDPERGDRLELINLVGQGIADGPNRNNTVTLNGFASPITADAEVSVKITGQHIISEPAIRAAIPREAREALRTLDPSGKGDFPTFKSNIAADVYRALGPNQRYSVVLTMDLEDAAGAFEGFAYPLENITGRLVIGGNYVKIQKFTAKKGDASVTLDGGLTWGKDKPLTPDIALSARNVRIDKTLLAAIAPDRRAWLEKLGVSGKLDVEGKILRNRHVGSALADGISPQTAALHSQAIPSAKADPTTEPRTLNPQSDIDVVLDMTVHDGAIWPRDSTFAVSDVSGKLHLAGGQVTLTDFNGRRGKGTLSGGGSVAWVDHQPQLNVAASAKNLLLEPALYGLLPKDAQIAWDAVQPEGTVDASLQYGREFVGSSATTRPSPQPSYQLTLTPSKLAATLKSLPYRLTDLSGTITVTPQGAVLQKVTGRHKAATIELSGTYAKTGGSDSGVWQLHMTGSELPVDDELRKAVPASLAKLLDTMKLRGTLGLDFQKLNYYPGVAKPGGVVADGDLDLAGAVTFNSASMDVGVPVTDAQGGLLTLEDVGIRAGKLAGLKGSVKVESLKLADRPVKNFYAVLAKPPTQDAMRIDKIQAALAGGELAGQVELGFPDNGASRYALGLVLRNADVPQLTGEKEQIKGQLTASFALEGAWNDPSTRRGRGDVTVAGRDMYRIPLILGLLQITNLSLPISSPFSQANARYSVEGQKVTFEQIELRSSNMVMQGSGSLDFQSRKVKMTFVTDNPHSLKLPIVNDLLEGAKHELLQIHVNGTIERPKVSGTMMDTFQTTVDEVMRGSDAEAESSKRHR